MMLKIIYFIHRINYSGDNVGSDWTFYFSNMAGISKLNSSIKIGETDYDPKVIAVVDAEENQNLVDTWWISATEKDRAYNDQGVSARFRVPFVVELGAEHVRTITFEVAEKSHDGTVQPARLSFLIGIVIDDPNAKIPPIDATLLPIDSTEEIELPVKTAGDFPNSFKAIAYGKDPKSIPVVAEKNG